MLRFSAMLFKLTMAIAGAENMSRADTCGRLMEGAAKDGADVLKKKPVLTWYNDLLLKTGVRGDIYF